MRRLAVLVFLVTLLATLPARADAADWAEPASSLNQTEAAGQPFDGTRYQRNVGTPVVEVVGGILHAAWTEWDGQNFEVRAARLEGNRWVALGSGCSPINVDSGRNAADVDLADHGGRPVVAWVEEDAAGVSQVQLARFEQGEWQQPWGAATNEPPVEHADYLNDSLGTDVAVVDGRVYIGSRIVRPVPYLNQVHRLRADETGFEKLEAADNYDSHGFELHTDGEELYAWTQDPTAAHLMRFEGGEWKELPPPDEDELSTFFHEMTVHEGDAYVVYTEYSSGEGTTWLRRFAGGAWTERQAVRNETGGPQGVISSLAMVDGTPTIATVDGAGVHVYEQFVATDGYTAFVQVGSTVNQSDSRHPDDPTPNDADLVDLGGRPYVAWAGWSGTIWKAKVAGLLDAPPSSVPAREQVSCAAPAQGGGGESGGGDAGANTPPGTPPGGTAPPVGGPTNVQVPSLSRDTTGRLVLLNPRSRARGRIVRLRVLCTGARRCRGTAIARARSRIRGMEIGRVRVNLARGEVATIRLRLTPRAIRMLRRGPVRYALKLRTPV